MRFPEIVDRTRPIMKAFQSLELEAFCDRQENAAIKSWVQNIVGVHEDHRKAATSNATASAVSPAPQS